MDSTHALPDTKVPRCLTIDELARLWRIQAGTLRLWARQGRLPGFKLGDKWLFAEDDLVAFVENRREQHQGDKKEGTSRSGPLTQD